MRLIGVPCRCKNEFMIARDAFDRVANNGKILEVARQQPIHVREPEVTADHAYMGRDIPSELGYFEILAMSPDGVASKDILKERDYPGACRLAYVHADQSAPRVPSPPPPPPRPPPPALGPAPR